MKVILQKDVKSLGKEGEVVTVAEGYGRNYLIPRGLAEEATKGALKELKLHKKVQERRQNKKEEEAIKLKDKLEKMTITVKVKAGETGKLFGSVTSKDIVNVLRQKKVKVDKRKIELEEPIRNLGSYQVPIRVYKDTLAQLTVDVVAE